VKIRDRIKELRRVKASELRPNPKNWRIHPSSQQDALRGVLAEIGYADALIAREAADGTLELLDGHLRAETTPDMEVPVLIVDLTDAEADKLLATLDPMAALAETNKDQLGKLLHDISTDNEGLQAMLDDLAGQNGIDLFEPGADGEDAPEAQVDRAAELQEQWKTERGQLWEIQGKAGVHRLLCGDSTEAEDVELVMGGEKASLFATDPPYGVAYNDETGTGDGDTIQNDENDGPKLQAFLEATFTAWLPSLRDDAAWYLWHAQLTQGFFAAAAAAADILIHRQIIWVKPSLVLGHGDYHWRHELCFYGWRKGHRCPWYGDRSQTTVWEMGREGDAPHPTQKPVEAYARPLKVNTKPREVCADPFLGSGTTMVAAEQLGRICYGIEIEPKYCAVILQRMTDMGLEPRQA